MVYNSNLLFYTLCFLITLTKMLEIAQYRRSLLRDTPTLSCKKTERV